MADDRQVILIVEDEESIRETLRQSLEFEGFSVRTAGNGREALQLLGVMAPPCIILLDLMMPVMNGWELVDALKADPRLAGIPVVVITAFNDKARTIQANGVLKKPIDLEVLYDAIRRYCGEGGGGE